MNRKMRILGVAGLLTVLAVVPACSDDDSDAVDSEGTTATTTEPTGTTGATDTSEDTDTSVAPVAGTEVTIVEYAFAPEALTVAVGDTVTWTNEDEFAHGTAGDADEWASGDIATGATFEHTFDEAGTFAYHCSIHNFMKGEIVVEG